jgi:hypothetical protein
MIKTINGPGDSSALFICATPRHNQNMVRNNRFNRFACVDWSGATVARPAGIAVATIETNGTLQLVRPSHRWSRLDVLSWLLELFDNQDDILIGLDLSFGFPFLDTGSYFPDWPQSPDTAFKLWAMIDHICINDPHLAANSFLTHAEGHRHFRHSKDQIGDQFTGGIGRLRLVERHQRETKQANSWSCFNLVGAGQVGKSSLTGMRLLHRLAGRIPIWPFDPLPDHGPVIVEIYTSIAARAAGIPANRSKMRDIESLTAALANLDTIPPSRLIRIDDHATDAQRAGPLESFEAMTTASRRTSASRLSSVGRAPDL